MDVLRKSGVHGWWASARGGTRRSHWDDSGWIVNLRGMEDCCNPVAFAAYKRLGTTKCVVVGTILNTGPFERVGDTGEDASVS